MHRLITKQRRALGTLALLCGLCGLTNLTPVSIGTAYASGGFGGGGGGGGGSVYNTPRSASPRTESIDTEALASYNRGKSIYESRLACTECPLAGVSLNETLARELLFYKRGVILSHDEIYALDVYLKRRFRL